MRIATFNANSIRSRLTVILDWMASQKADILCVQETKVQDHDFPKAAIEEAGYHVVFRGEKSYNGVAIISRAKPTEVLFGLDDGEQADPTRFIHARFGNLAVINTYVPQGRSIDDPMYAYKLKWFKRLHDYFNRHFKTTDQVVWAGDFNVAQESIDVYSPEELELHVCYHKKAREALRACREWGFVDVFRRFHPEAGQYTFYDYRALGGLRKGLGWRIDYIMATKPLSEKASDSFIDLEPRKQPKSSDHTFLVADFKI